MNFKITFEMEQQILNLAAGGMTKKDIAATIKCSPRSVFNVLKAYRVPMPTEKKLSKQIKISDLISTHLLHYCDDLEILSKRLALEILYARPEKIVVPARIQRIIDSKKINKVVSIVRASGVPCQLEYAMCN